MSAFTNFSPVGLRSSNGRRMCVCVCVCVSVGNLDSNVILFADLSVINLLEFEL